MDAPNLKLLKKLADSCRKAGIESFEGYGFKFTLGEVYHSPRKTTPSRPGSTEVNPEPKQESDELSPEALMFWSTGDLPDDSTDRQ